MARKKWGGEMDSQFKSMLRLKFSLWRGFEGLVAVPPALASKNRVTGAF
jgi:hypothetical protein